jgi:predicted NBD/HSP70 family sugar kinase
LLAVQVGAPGYVVPDEGKVSWSGGLDWHDFPLSQLITEALDQLNIRGIHVGIANDCHLAGLHASRVELGLPSDAVAVYYGGMRGVGSTVIIGGEIYGGAHGAAGDFGHQNVDPGGTLCWCGRHGCLQTMVGLEYLLDQGGLMSRQEALSLIDAEPHRATQLIVEAAGAENTRMLETLERAGDALGYALDDLLGIVNPHTAIIGDYLGVLSPYLLPVVNRRVQVRTALPAFVQTQVMGLEEIIPRVVRGGALAARDAVLNDPLGLTRIVS